MGIKIDNNRFVAPHDETDNTVAVPRKLRMTSQSEAVLRKSARDTALCGVAHKTDGIIHLRPYRAEPVGNDERYATTEHPAARVRAGSEAPEKMVAVQHFDPEAKAIHEKTGHNRYVDESGSPLVPNGHKQTAFLSGIAEDDLVGFSIRVDGPSEYRLVCTSRLLNGEKFNNSKTDGRMSREWANAIRNAIHKQVFIDNC